MRTANLRDALIVLVMLMMSLGMITICHAQSAPLVLAFGAPDCTNSTGTTTCNGSGSTNAQHYMNFLQYLAPYVSGIVLTIPWNEVDACTTNAIPPVSQPCSMGQATSCSQETASGSQYYKWCPVDQGLLQYINSPSFNGKKIALIIAPVTDTGMNTYTPQYVFSTAWAGNSHVSSNPQDVIVCSAYPGDIPGGSSCPVSGSFGGTGTNADVAIWNVNGYSVGPSNACLTLSGTNLSCAACGSGVSDFTGFPIVYEKPFMVAYQNFLADVAQHYNPNPSVGLNYGSTIAPYIAYVRAGMTEGGENQQFCTTVASNPTQPTSPISNPPAGYIVNINGTEYVATGSGSRTGAMPGCSPSGCTTAPDGTVPSWYNAGPWTLSPTVHVMWPGPKGRFGSGAEPAAYTDNGYLSTWADTTSDGPGYIALMTQFLQSLNASFPFDINAHNGPPSASNVAYADSEAIMASASNIGFGMESVNVYDPLLYSQGTYSQNPMAFPTSLSDWAHNFITYPAPVHHLQTFFPGSPTRAPGYLISGIAGGSTATITCISDCSIYTSSQTPGYPIYISGDSTANFNGITQANECPGTGCTTGQLSFSPLDYLAPNGTGGTVWAPDYLPIIVPFAVRQGTTAFEIYECDLDYAFGLYIPSMGVTNQTTYWGTANGNCVPPPSSGPYSPLAGPDSTYQNSLFDAMMGQPTSTSFRTGTSILSNANQY